MTGSYKVYSANELFYEPYISQIDHTRKLVDVFE